MATSSSVTSRTEFAETTRANGARPADHRSELSTYGSLLAAFVLLLARLSGQGREDTRIDLSDVALIGLASSEVARIVARDRATVFLRAPFTSDDAAQQPTGDGMRRTIGELLTCPHCSSVWIAAALSALFLRSPRRARFLSAVFAGQAVSTAGDYIARRSVRR